MGGDVAPSLIKLLQEKFPEKEFRVLDISKDPLPRVDLVFCRDLFVHLTNSDIKAAIKNIKSSGSKFLLTTTFLNTTRNKNLPFITRGIAWRKLNLQESPFNFPISLSTIDEKCTEGGGLYSDKALSVWKISELP